jgi:hypothetical protein
LEIHINNFTILIDRSPQKMLPAIDLDEHLVYVERVAVSSVRPLQSSRVYSSEFDTPKSDGLSADGDATLSQQIFDVTVAQIETIVEPDSITDDVRREPVTFICIQEPIL